jgi:hypothetical protein
MYEILFTYIHLQYFSLQIFCKKKGEKIRLRVFLFSPEGEGLPPHSPIIAQHIQTGWPLREDRGQDS